MDLSKDEHKTQPLLHFLQGFLMGSADIIPGVSGGTIALIVGIYDRLVYSIGIGVNAVTLLLRGQIKAAWKRLLDIRWLFIFPLLFGIMAAIFAASRFLPGLLATYPLVMNAIFFGLIAGSLPVPVKAMETKVLPKHMVIMVLSAIAAFFLVGLQSGTDVSSPSALVIFLSAMLAIVAMILPGISGAYILVVLGLYAPTLQAVHERNFVYLAIFIAGATIGLTLFSTFLSWLLLNHRAVTLAALTGLMAGSLRTLWPWSGPLNPADIGTGLISMIFGLLIVRLLSKIEHYVTITSK